ncbi:polysaccharide pyruvyl transferase family protein [Stutzerimonas azotifigens]|uniref:Polysaccharide pyruvyl transferase family protein n=1 Tax=Stutzerimonas azotifigens TaxID=291995 RepID=A0ABR5Z4U8_9GAMM|nr:polysaccharide pyruvyl transferase family protein [Stutzerimonas azotifigens]MBA1275169.1 polysaccharide pyruvyl transferase family protein [Stutzerimonas azotifigens]
MKFGLLWHSFSSGNLGVGALSISNMLLIDEAARKKGITPEFLIIGSSGPSNYPPSTERFKYEFIEFNEKTLLKSPLTLLNAIRSCDAVFDIGEGDSFSDIYGNKRLIKLLLSKGMALTGHVPLILSPQTIGPFKSDIAAKASAYVMKKSSMVFARDHQSFSVLNRLDIENRDEVIDVAFALPFTRSSEHRSPDRLAVGISVSALLHHGGYEGSSNQFGLRANYEELTSRLIEALIAQGHEVHLVPHVIPLGFPEEDDYTVSEALRERYPQLKLAPRFKGPIEAKSYISGLDFFIGARMHATIGAFSAGIPVVPLAYSRKFSGLYESLDYHRVVDLKTESTDSALQKVLDSLENREQLRQEVAAGAEIIKRKLAAYGAALEDIMTSLIQGQPAYQE